MASLEQATKDLGAAIVGSGKAAPKVELSWWGKVKAHMGPTVVRAEPKFWPKAGAYVLDTVLVPVNAATGVLKLLGIGAAKGTLATTKGATHGLVWFAEQPLVGVMKLMTGAAKFVHANKGPVAIAAGAAAVVGFGMHARAKAEAQTQQDLINQMQGRSPSYMNSVTPQEYANMQAAMQAGKNGGAGFADAATARAADSSGGQAPVV